MGVLPILQGKIVEILHAVEHVAAVLIYPDEINLNAGNWTPELLEIKSRIEQLAQTSSDAVYLITIGMGMTLLPGMMMKMF